MGQRDNTPQTLGTTGLVSVPNNGTKGDNNGTNRYFFKKRISETMKIKLFTREHVSDGIHETLGFEKSRIENDVEFETRINDFMIDKNVVSVQSLKDSVFVTYAD